MAENQKDTTGSTYPINNNQFIKLLNLNLINAI